jgi:hypothetical protein
MKKLFLVGAAVAAMVTPADAGQNYPEPCNIVSGGTSKIGPLCNGLIERFAFEENAGSNRYGVFGSVIMEKIGADLSRGALVLNGPGGAYAASFNGTSDYLYAFPGGLPTGSSTVALWFRPTSLPSTVGNKATLISNDNTNIPGPEIYLETTATSPTQAKVCYRNYEAETNNALTVCSASNSIQLNTTYHVAVGESPYFVGKARLFLSLNGATMLTTTEGYYTGSGGWVLVMGAHLDKMSSGTYSQYFAGLIDELWLFSRPLTQAEITLLYNSNNGSSYPPATE